MLMWRGSDTGEIILYLISAYGAILKALLIKSVQGSFNIILARASLPVKGSWELQSYIRAGRKILVLPKEFFERLREKRLFWLGLIQI